MFYFVSNFFSLDYQSFYNSPPVKQFISNVKEEIKKKVDRQEKVTSQVYIDGLMYAIKIIDGRAGDRLI